MYIKNDSWNVPFGSRKPVSGGESHRGKCYTLSCKSVYLFQWFDFKDKTMGTSFEHMIVAIAKSCMPSSQGYSIHTLSVITKNSFLINWHCVSLSPQQFLIITWETLHQMILLSLKLIIYFCYKCYGRLLHFCFSVCMKRGRLAASQQRLTSLCRDDKKPLVVFIIRLLKKSETRLRHCLK